MRALPEDFWYRYREDLEKFLKTPRSTFLELFVPVVVAIAIVVTAWSFALLVSPFVYSLYPAYRRSKPIDYVPVWAY